MRVNWKKLALCLAIPLAVGGLAALLSGGFGQDYASWRQPPLAPPGWLFPVVWTALYALMGWASYLVLEAGGDQKKALTLYGAQLLVNFLWPLVFFGLENVGFALVLLVILWVLVLWTIREFSELSEKAGDLMIPYILWLSFALYLNFGIFILN